ncbi:MAG: MATE family efflux transporter [Bacillota bacterium]|nr:MATE family efflux transporter [Bacillota bacterium]
MEVISITIDKTDDRLVMSRSIWHLAWPTVVEVALQTAVQYVDVALVGRISAHASAVVGLTGSVNWFMNSAPFAAGIGALACISQAAGAKEYYKMRVASMQSIFMAVIIGLTFGTAALVLSPFIPAWLGAGDDIAAEASMYFSIISAPMIFRSLCMVQGSVLRAAGDTRTPMLVNGFMNIVNIGLCFFLIYPTRAALLFNASITIPGMGLGVRGAAIGTAVSFSLGGIMMFLSVLRNESVNPVGVPVAIDKKVMGECVSVSFPVLLQRSVTCIGQIVFSALVVSLGTGILAAHSIAITAEQAFYIPGYGMQAAAATLAGNSVGKRDEKELSRVTLCSIMLNAAIMIVMGGLLFLLSTAVMSIFTSDAFVIKHGASALRIVALSEPLYGVSIILEGIFMGVGDARAPFYTCAFSMWVARILPTLICVNVLGLGLNAVWCCMVADNSLRFVIYLIRYLRGSYKRRIDFTYKPAEV